MRPFKILFPAFLTCFSMSVFAEEFVTGMPPWTAEAEAMYQSLPEFSLPAGLAKLLPWSDDIKASSLNIRDELLQNGTLSISGVNTSNIKDQDDCGSCHTNAIVTCIEYFVKRELILNKEWPFSLNIQLLKNIKGWLYGHFFTVYITNTQMKQSLCIKSKCRHYYFTKTLLKKIPSICQFHFQFIIRSRSFYSFPRLESDLCLCT